MDLSKIQARTIPSPNSLGRAPPADRTRNGKAALARACASSTLGPVAVENSNPYILMMQAAQEWNRRDVADRLHAPEVRRIFLQREMDPNLVVIRSVGLQDATQVRLVELHYVVEAVAADRSDEALDVAVLPRRAGRGGAKIDRSDTGAVIA